jgi:hypothetical protein
MLPQLFVGGGVALVGALVVLILWGPIMSVMGGGPLSLRLARLLLALLKAFFIGVAVGFPLLFLGIVFLVVMFKVFGILGIPFAAVPIILLSGRLFMLQFKETTDPLTDQQARGKVAGLVPPHIIALAVGGWLLVLVVALSCWDELRVVARMVRDFINT